MSKSLLALLLTFLSMSAYAHNAPFPHAEMHHEVAHLLVHALFALPVFIAAWIGFKVWQRYSQRNER